MSIASIGEALENPSVTQLLAAYPTKDAFDAAVKAGKIKPTTEAGVAANIYNRIVGDALAKQAQAQAQSTVFQEMTAPQVGLAAAQQMPQQAPQRAGQGLDQVPVPPQMFDERRMAGGGIVAFQPGGRVKNTQLIGTLESILSQLKQRDPALNVDYVRQSVLSAPENQQRMLMQQLIESTGMRDQFAPAAASFTESLKTREVDPKVLRAMQVSGGLTPDEMATPSPLTKEAAGLAAVARRDAAQADTGAQYGARPLTGSQILAQKANAAGNIYARPSPPMTTDVSGMPGTFAPYESAIADLGQGVPEPIDPFSATQGRTSIRGGQTDTGAVDYSQEAPSSEMLKKAAEEETKKAEEKPSADKKEEGPKSYDAYLRDVQKMMGQSTVGKGMREDIEADRAARKEAKEQAGWIRLVEAGLGIMGGESPYALVNIGKGATNALKSYADDLREQKKLDREDRKILLDLERAERAEQRDNYKLAAELREKALDRMSAEKRSNISAQASMYAADKSVEAAGMLRPTTEASIRNNASTATEGRLLLDPKFREAQKRKDQTAMMQRRNEIFAEELRKLTPGGGMNVNTSALGPVIDFQTALGAR